MEKRRNRYKEMERYLTYALLADAGLFVVYLLVAGVDGEVYMVVYQRQTFKLPHDVGQLDAVAFQELAPRREIAEDVFYHDVGPSVADTGFLALHLRAVDFQAGANLVVLGAGTQLHLRYGAD